MKMKKMMKIASISGLAVATVVLISGCGATPRVYYPQKMVFTNGVTYNPTWDGYNECYSYNDRPNAECYLKDSNGTRGAVIKVLEPDFELTLYSFIQKFTSSGELCNTVEKLQLSPGYSCTATVRDRLLKANNYEKAYSWGLLDKKTWLLHNGKILEAYQAGLIDKDTARTEILKQWGLLNKKTWLLHDGEILQAY